MAEGIKHLDRLGREVKLDDCVVAPYNNSLMIAKVVKLNPKMVKIKKFSTITRPRSTGEYSKYSNDLVILNGPEVTAYLLKL
jgi:hypothetical protein